MPSISECRQPYLLSNFDLVTESLTLIAGNSSAPALCISYSRCTPVVVSSVTPLMPWPMAVQRCGSSAAASGSAACRTTAYSSESAVDGSGTAPAFSNSVPLCTSMVASPPSSRIMFGPSSPGQFSACSVHHQYSSSVSPFQAKTGTPAGASGVPSRADDDRGGSVVLGGEDVAGDPAHLGAERGQRLDQHRGLDGHVQRAHDLARRPAACSRRTARASPSGRASRARRAGSPCARTRPSRGPPPCSRTSCVLLPEDCDWLAVPEPRGPSHAV